jgi:hypothetical protein
MAIRRSRGGLMKKLIPAVLGLVAGVVFGETIRTKVPFLGKMLPKI